MILLKYFNPGLPRRNYVAPRNDDPGYGVRNLGLYFHAHSDDRLVGLAGADAGAAVAGRGSRRGRARCQAGADHRAGGIGGR